MMGKRSLILVFLFYWIYLLIGAVVFHYLETPKETETTGMLRAISEQFLKNNTCVNRDDYIKLLKAVISAYDEGVLITNNATSTNWDFGSAYFFSATVVTTIGYGHITPMTVGGRAFCIFYAILGIPLSAVLLAGLGERLLALINKVKDSDCFGDKEEVKKGVVGAILIVGGVVIFMLIPAAIMTRLEGWDMAEALYYAFISLTTIGFGDYVIGVNSDSLSKEWYRGLMSIWIVLGLTWMASILTYIGDLVKKRAEAVDEKIESIQLGKRNGNKATNDSMHAQDQENNTTTVGGQGGQTNKGFVSETTDGIVYVS